MKRLLPIHCSGSSAHRRPQVLADGGPIKTRSITQKLSSIWLPETPTTAQNTGNNFEGKITFNNVRLSAAKVRFAQSKFSYLQTQRRER